MSLESHNNYNEKLSTIKSLIKEPLDPFILEYFEDENLFNALADRTDEEIAEFIKHTGKFAELIWQQRQKNTGLFGEEIIIPGTDRPDRKKRRKESGQKINLEFMKQNGIDPSKILFFRITQPSEIPKSELYWTSDYWETQKGLSAEISTEKRRQAITLVLDLETINKNGGLIMDKNDDAGISVRQIELKTFDQKLAIGKIEPKK